MSHILIIDKADRTRELLQSHLTPQAKIKAVDGLDAAWEKLRSRKFDLILWDTSADPAAQVNLPQTLKTLSTKVLGAKAIVFSGSENCEATRDCGQNIQVQKHPFNDDALLSLVSGSLPRESCGALARAGKNEPELPTDFEGIIAVSLPMRAVVRSIMEAAAVDIPVLITGETGTGKDLVAAAIHKRSRRKSKPYVAINTGAIAPELIASELFGHERGAFTGAQESRSGIFEQADGGTVFLDEIATMDEKTQISLLRVLEEKTFRRVGGAKNINADVRIIAATNELLEKNVVERRFREDLFYRLNVFHIDLPPLRDRPGAVMVLTDHFLSHFSAVYGKEIERVSPETYRLLRHYRWPGNVRELKNVLQTAVLMVDGKELTPDFIPQRIRDASVNRNNRGDMTCSFSVGVTLGAVEKELIRLTLASVRGNKKQTAAVLGISRRALYNKLKKHRLA